MCGITGWVNWQRHVTDEHAVLEKMTESLEPRGPDASGWRLSSHAALGHRRLSVIDPEHGAQPMTRRRGGEQYTIVYNGELYNALELRANLKKKGCYFETRCDTEVLLMAYMYWGEAFLEKLNGIFAFAIWSETEKKLILVRDRLGVKPLFYFNTPNGIIFGSEPKSLLAHPSVQPQIAADGMAEVFAVSPARTPGHGIYRGMSELRPGCAMICKPDKQHIWQYWTLSNNCIEDSDEQAAATVRELLTDTVERQLISDVPICTLLSGGLDSSALSALAKAKLQRDHRGPLYTYSVTYKNQASHFQAHDFQPDNDHPWIERMVSELQSIHQHIELTNEQVADALRDVVYARDMPGMADIDSSLLLFCHAIKRESTVALSGEAADEVFGGYPWFRRAESLEAETFPWSLAVPWRAAWLSTEMREYIKPEAYVAARYEEALSEVPYGHIHDETERKMRKMSYLNITRFMPTLLDRKDRMSMAAGLEVRVPFCDHRLVDYVWQLPWAQKNYGGREKGILRRALQGILPEDVLYRKKSPYPKTHDPEYGKIVRNMLRERIGDPQSPLAPLLDKPFLQSLLDKDASPTEKPWFGQLMSGPQLSAYLYQIDLWMSEYQIKMI